jgi:hypothetical protein
MPSCIKNTFGPNFCKDLGSTSNFNCNFASPFFPMIPHFAVIGQFIGNFYDDFVDKFINSIVVH